MASDLFDSTPAPRYGVYQGDIRDCGLAPWCPPGVPSFLKSLRNKRWRFVGVFSPGLVLGAAVVDARYLGTSFAYVFDLTTNTLVEFKGQSPLAAHVDFSDHCRQGRAAFVKGRDRIVMEYRDDGEPSTLVVDVGVPSGRITVEVAYDESDATMIPHQVISPTPGGSVAFTHKAAGLPASGVVTTPGGSYRLEASDAFAAVDHTAGYHDRFWEWRWASLGGMSQQGVRVGLNLVEPVHHPVFTENALWVERQPFPVSGARFQYDKGDIMKPWRITSDDGLVDLTFTPKGQRQETINALVLKSCFHQPAGLFNGVLKEPGGTAHQVKDLPGVVEEHEALW